MNHAGREAAVTTPPVVSAASSASGVDVLGAAVGSPVLVAAAVWHPGGRTMSGVGLLGAAVDSPMQLTA